MKHCINIISYTSGCKRGRPRIHAVKIKVPGRKRGRPSKPKVEGQVPKLKGPRGRPRKENQAKLKVVFLFEDKYDLSPEEMRKLKMEGAKLPDAVQKKRGRKKKVDANPCVDAENGLGPKKRGRPKKVKGAGVSGRADEEKVRKKRGPYKKRAPKLQQFLQLPGGWCVTKRRRQYRSRTLGQIGKELVEKGSSSVDESAVLESDAFNSTSKESSDEWAMKFWQTLLMAQYQVVA
jgi:hypothetical protein